MFSQQERRKVELKALEQAMREAGVANADIELLLPINTWPFRLTRDDIAFLKSCPYPISPA